MRGGPAGRGPLGRGPLGRGPLGRGPLGRGRGSAVPGGALRGAAAGGALVLVVVTAPLLVWGSTERAVAPLTLPVAVLGALLGGPCGALAGALLDAGRTWRAAALASGATALALLAGVLWLVSGTVSARPLWVPLGAGALLLAAWQSRALERRRGGD